MFNSFPEYLMALRNKRGLEAQVAAALCGCSKETWSHFECGRRKPTAAQLYAMSRLFRVSMTTLYVASDPVEADAARKRAGR